MEVYNREDILNNRSAKIKAAILANLTRTGNCCRFKDLLYEVGLAPSGTALDRYRRFIEEECDCTLEKLPVSGGEAWFVVRR